MAQFGDGYVGTAADSERIRRQEKQRADARKKFESLKKQSEDRIDSAGLRQFGTSTSEALEHAFKNETVGLVTKAEFIQKRTTLQERIEEEMRKKVRDEEDVALREKERRKREKMANRPKLSFAAEEEEDAETGTAAAAGISPAHKNATTASATTAAGTADDARAESGADATSSGQGLMLPPPAKKAKFGKLGKDPTVATGFLPDKERQRQEEELRLELRREWQQQQDKIKAEPLDITYSYWDGTGHRRNIIVPKGATIGQFLKGVRDQLAPTFRELRATSVDNLMYIKEDLIMPHHHTFYDLIINKARGKSGPLFSFNVHEDIRITNDASVEKTDSHAGKIVERHWYDKNKHIFPASRWEIYDPEKQYDTYTTHGQEVNAKAK